MVTHETDKVFQNSSNQEKQEQNSLPKNKNVSVCLMGASKPEQIDENVKAIEVAKKWTLDLEKKINDILCYI